MTEIRIKNQSKVPMIIFHEDMLETDVQLNLKFGQYELNYGGEPEEEKHCMDCGLHMEQSFLTVKENGKDVFSKHFGEDWIVFIEITKTQRSGDQYRINAKIYNMNDGDTCETCENNRFNFEVDAVVNNFYYRFYSPSKGEFQDHPLPTEAEELDEKVKEELK